MLMDSLNMDKNDYQIYYKYQRGVVRKILYYYKDESPPLQVFALVLSKIKSSSSIKEFLENINGDSKVKALCPGMQLLVDFLEAKIPKEMQESTNVTCFRHIGLR
jgi:hypothetical protein